LRNTTALSALTALTLLCGCGSGSRDAADLTEQIKVGQLVSSLEDVKKNPKLIGSWFAQGAAPPDAELRKFAKFTTYKTDGLPTVSGDTATAKVNVLGPNDQILGTVEWTFVREGGHWKIKSAPLP
jgi:hypothetical protein